MGPLWRVWDRHGRGQKIAPSGGRKSGPARGPERGARRGLRGPENGLRGARSGFSASNILSWGLSTFERGVSGWRGNVKMRVGEGVWGRAGAGRGPGAGRKRLLRKAFSGAKNPHSPEPGFWPSAGSPALILVASAPHQRQPPQPLPNRQHR